MKKLETLKTKLQESKKFRTQVALILVATILVTSCAIAIPVEVHTQNMKKATAAQEATPADESLTAEPVSTEPQTTEPTTEAPTETIPETTTTAAVTEKTTTKKTTSKNSNSAGSTKKNTPASTTKKSNSSSKNSGSSGSKNNTTTAQTTVPSHDWPKATVDAIIAKARAYGESLGLRWNDDWSKEDNNWSFPERSIEGDEQYVLGQLKYQLDHLAARYVKEGSMPGGDFKVYAERVPCEYCGPVLGIKDYQWTFYVSPNSGA